MTRARLLRLIPLVILGAVAVGLIVLRPNTGAVVKVGETAPAIAGTTIDGQRFDLATLRGRPVLVNFWASWCGPCRDEFPLLKARLAELGPSDLAVVGVLYRDQTGPARDFAREMGAGWPTVVDADGALERSYRVVAPPQSYFIDRQGVVRALHIGEILDEDFAVQYAKIAG